MKRYSLLISTVILCLLFLRLSCSRSDNFKEVTNAYNSVAVNLVRETNHTSIADVIKTLDGIDKKDVDFIAKHIEEKLKKPKKEIPLNSLHDFNKRAWQIPSTAIDNRIGSSGLKKKLEKSRESLGQDKEYAFRSLSANLKFLSDTLNLCAGNGVIKVKVTETKDATDNIFKLFSKKIEEPCQKVLIRLSEHYIDSSGVNAKTKKKPIDSLVVRKTLAWAKTNDEGECTFSGLDATKSYSVLPIKKGYEYGMPRGTTSGSLMNSSKESIQTYSFAQQEHKIRMFDAKTLAQIRERHALTLRTPQEYKHISTWYLILFFAAWWGVYWIRSHKHKNSDNDVIAILMLLTGLCFLVMLSMYDPLEDALYGIDMAQGIIIGVVVIGILQYVNFTDLYQDRLRIGFDIPLACINWLFKPFSKKISGLIQVLSNKKYKALRKWIALLGIILCLPLLLLDLIRITKLGNRVSTLIAKLPKGCGYLFVALFLTVLLFPFGSEIGGMKVNFELPGLTFQPSEIAKYLIVFFMAAFFSSNADSIIKYSKKGNSGLFGRKLKMLSVITVGLCLLLSLYVSLGDIGPALVLAFTFIILYSIVKSKVNLENLDERGQNTKILTCDLAMLAYGVISFIVLLHIGNAIDQLGFFCFIWFILWIILGCVRKQVFESAILFNLMIVAFIYGGKVLSFFHLSSIAERLESRNEMCLNTWGTLPIDGMVAKAGENTQIAEGLWGLASGGIWGQGLGEGSPHFIPAFHTDMIMASIGEQLGFLGIFVIIFLLSLLLRKAVLIGYRTSHPFAFYLCSGIAIVTAIQFAIISLGSTGIIPLTGVTVPFLSYGKVSMLLNLVAFGIILSYTPVTVKNKAGTHSISEKNIGQYNYPVSVLSWLYCALAVFIGSVFFYYQFINRDETLVRPVYINNANGAPVVEYNPRIKPLIHKMYAGDIYDRNHTLLATSDKSKLLHHKGIYSKYGLMYDTLKQQQRYYPFGEHLFFMLGDYSKVPSFSIERGYLAEARHRTELYGYDDVLRDSQGKPVVVDLRSDAYRPQRFYSPEYSKSLKKELKDYSALIPYLKAGLNSNKITRLNDRNKRFWETGRIEPQDVQLTIDAALQVRLQQEMLEYMRKNYSDSKWNKCRVSIVVLDAKEGDLLASANYPLPDYNRLKNAPNKYSDNYKKTSWKAYSDMDLGLIFPTAPGSTAKVLSALAGFRKDDDKIVSQTYYIDPKERIYSREPAGMLDMKKALRHSSNCYFVNLVNDKSLYKELASIYGNVGIQIYGKKSYTIDYAEPNNDWQKNITNQEKKCVEAYVKYKRSRIKETMNHRTGKPREWAWAWGQNYFEATPATMARAISIVTNGGKMPVTRFLLKTPSKGIEIVSSSAADSMSNFLKYTAKEHDKFNLPVLGGKTGTPERDWKNIFNRTQIINDGWFICFIENTSIRSIKNTKEMHRRHPLAIAVRMERINDVLSGKAVDFTKNVVLKVLKELEYINDL